MHSPRLRIQGCSFQTSGWSNAETNRPGASPLTAAVAWNRTDPDNPGGSRIEVGDTVFLGESASLHVTPFPQLLRAANCLKLGPGPFVSTSTGSRLRRDCRLDFRNVTLRRASSLVRFNGPGNDGSTILAVAQSVLDLDGHDAAILQFSADGVAQGQTRSIEVLGDDTLTRPGVVVAVRLNPPDNVQTVWFPSGAIDPDKNFTIAIGEAYRVEVSQAPSVLVPEHF